MMSFLAVALFALLFAGVVYAFSLVVRDTTRGEGELAIDTGSARCPSCGEPLPAAHLPNDAKQALFGGSACARCGAELDPRGRPRA